MNILDEIAEVRQKFMMLDRECNTVFIPHSRRSEIWKIISSLPTVFLYPQQDGKEIVFGCEVVYYDGNEIKIGYVI